jgi:hypothetical protein
MQDEAHLVGIGRAARGAIAGQLGLVALDQVFGLAAHRERVVNVLGRAFCQRGDDIADVHAQRAGLNPGDDAALALPAFGAVAGLDIVAQDRMLGLARLTAQASATATMAGSARSAALVGKPNT